MNYIAIPAELRALRQWVVWRSVPSPEGRVTKPPFNPKFPSIRASITNPETWGSFAEAVAACSADQTLQGIGFVFTEDDGYFGIDIDDDSKVDPQYREMRKAVVSHILANMQTYSEFSPSGLGLHLIAKGRLPDKGRRSSRLQVELYGAERYFTMTGHIYEGRVQITDQQANLDQLLQAIDSAQQTSAQSPGDIDTMRRNDLSDEEVVRLATNYHPQFAPRFNAQIGCQPGQWSETFIAVIGTLDRFTGLVAQIERIIMSSPMVLHAPPAASGETRLDKAKRNFNQVLARVRGNNTVHMQSVEHGRQVWEAMQRHASERAALAAEAVRSASEAIANSNILAAFNMLGDAHRILTRPPGIVGEFVAATEGAMYHPFTKYAIPATFAALAGVIARQYKLPSGIGLNVNFILAAPSATGKTQTMDVWQHFLDSATAQIGNSLAGPARSRMMKEGTSSIQGIFEDFMATPSACWAIEECASQLMAMAKASTAIEMQLRDGYNALFDASRHNKIYTPPRSVANRRANITPINNLCISTYWTTTESKFDVFGSDALDGFLSRVNVVRHTGPAGEIVLRPTRDLTPRLKQVLVTLLAQAKKLDETYELSANDAAALITTVSTGGVDDLSESTIMIVERIKNASLSNELPPQYTAVSRLPMMAMRLAGIMAVVENPYAPSVTQEQYTWAFGYLLQNMTALLSDMDRGELGTLAQDDILAVVRAVREMLRTKEFKSISGVPRTKLRRLLANRKPFTDGGNIVRGTSKAIGDTIDLMLKEGLLSEVMFTPKGGRGRPIQLLCPTDDDIWQIR